MTSALRQKLKKIYFLRSSYHLYRAWQDRLQWGPESATLTWLDELYQSPDPWKYTSSQEEADRFESASRLLDSVQPRIQFEHGFEVGCAEGVFTCMLANRCKSLLAVDISEVALGRARQRCAASHVEFGQWNLLRSAVPPGMDLVVIMDVLELFFRPAEIKDARDKLVSALRPGGYLLLGNSRQSPIFETSWWGRWMLRGGKQISDLFARHPRLELVSSECGTIYINSLFRAK